MLFGRSTKPLNQLVIRALDKGYVLCGSCHLTQAATQTCVRCGSSISSRKDHHLGRAFALAITGLILMVPANAYPIVYNIKFGSIQAETIMSGVVGAFQADMHIIASLIFTASILIPLIKLLGVLWILYSIHFKVTRHRLFQTRLFRLIEVIGRWSMVDILVLGLVGSLIDMGAVANIEPGLGACYFILVIIVTMMATHDVDIRLLWDIKQESVTG